MLRYLFIVFIVRLIKFTIANYDACADPDPNFAKGSFPDDFIWATATASYQIEGGFFCLKNNENLFHDFSELTFSC